MAFLHMYLVDSSNFSDTFTAFSAALSQGVSLRGSGKRRQFLFQNPKFPIYYRHNLHNIIIPAL